MLVFCHELQCGGHFSGPKIAWKVLQSGLFWPTLFKDAHDYCQQCDICQRTGRISKRDEMPLVNNLVVDSFDVWGIDFMGLSIYLMVLHISWLLLIMSQRGWKQMPPVLTMLKLSLSSFMMLCLAGMAYQGQ